MAKPPSLRSNKRPTSDGMNVIAYLRVSTEKQVEEGVSLDAQKQRCEAYCAAMGYHLRDIIIDAGVSGGSLDRGGLKKARGGVGAGARRGEAWGLLVLKLDRLTRSLRDLSVLVEECEREGWYLLSISESVDTSTATGRMMVNLITLLSQWEREKIVERTLEAMAFKRTRGEYCGGGVPYGTRVDEEGKLIPYEPEIIVIEAARHFRSVVGSDAYTAIGRRLYDDGYMPRAGGPWAAEQIKRILASVRHPL